MRSRILFSRSHARPTRQGKEPAGFAPLVCFRQERSSALGLLEILGNSYDLNAPREEPYRACWRWSFFIGGKGRPFSAPAFKQSTPRVPHLLGTDKDRLVSTFFAYKSDTLR